MHFPAPHMVNILTYTETSVCPFVQTHHLCLHWGSHQPMCVCMRFLIIYVFTERGRWGRIGLFISRKALNHHVAYRSGKRKCYQLEDSLGALKRMASSSWHNLISLLTGYCPMKSLAAWPKTGYSRPNCIPLWNSVGNSLTPSDLCFGVCQVLYALVSLGFTFSHGLLQEFSPSAKTLQGLSHTLPGQTPQLVSVVFHKAHPWAAGVGRRLAKGPAHTRASLSHKASMWEDSTKAMIR